MVDLSLVHDAEHMRLLLESPAWKVLDRYLVSLRDEALKMMLDPRQEDQILHHWRGVYTGTERIRGLPPEIIAYEKANRS